MAISAGNPPESKSMSSSQLELIRLNHELVEKYELAVGDELDVKPNGVSLFK